MRLHFVKNIGSLLVLFALVCQSAYAAVTLEKQVKITDQVMFMDGVKRPNNYNKNIKGQYDYVFGPALTPHGDCIKAYGKYVFMTWYKGGKSNRHVMLTRYNTETNKLATIEFPHRHTGFKGKWWLGEAHNTIAVGICPKDGTIHMVYDMHRNGDVPSLANDYLRYSYSYDGAATVPDAEFTLDRFVNSPAGNYKHLAFNGINDVSTTKMLTYPAFFNNDDGDLFLKVRYGYSKNAKFLFAKFDGTKWKGYTQFNKTGAGSNGQDYNWGLYGDFKFTNGKLRIGFQKRSKNATDKYLYQNGLFYAYSDDPTGESQWKDYKGRPISIPIEDADILQIEEPGDFVQTTQKDKVRITGGNDFTVTDAGDEHFISHVKDLQYNVTKHLHTYRKAGDTEFKTVEYNAGGSTLYASGNNVYIFSLKDGRANIVKTEGGKSNFQQIYQHSTGPVFDKVVVEVSNGKAYYYLKEKGGTGDKRTTYLQIFDLGLNGMPPEDPEVDYTPPAGFVFAANGQDTVKINDGKTYDIAFGANGTFEYLREQTSDVYCYPTSFAKDPLPGIVKKCFTKELPNVAPVVSFNTPTIANVTITQGDAFYVDVNIKDENISYAELFIDGVLLRKESVAPYQWGDFEGANNANELDTLAAGSYTIKVVATDKEGLTGEASFTLNVQAEAPTILHSVGKVSNLNILAGAGGFRVTTGASPAELKVTNIRGQVVFSESGVFTNHFVPMKANGVYFIELSQGNKRLTQKYVAVHN